MGRLSLYFSLFIKIGFTLSRARYVNFNKNSDFIIWVPDFFSRKFIASDNFVRVMATFSYLKELELDVTVYTKKNIGAINNKKIIFFGSKFYNIYGFEDYVDIIRHISNMLEQQGNFVFPSEREARLWENKDHMHILFEKLDIRSPKSLIVDLSNITSAELQKLKYPLLLKEVHSCSANGVHKINNFEDLSMFINFENASFNNSKIILQELLNIRRDLRVICVGDEIVWHYWRINLAKEWKPTSTGYGSSVDFKSFPEQWRAWILEAFKKLNITTGAFDIAWDNDDLSQEPYILEVSPFYQPNPMPTNDNDLKNYGIWKKSPKLFGGYPIEFVKIVFQIQKQFVDAYLKNSNN